MKRDRGLFKEFYFRNWFWFHPIRRWEYGFLKSMVSGKFLDAGCGNGAITLALSARTLETCAVDVSDVAIATAEKYNNPGEKIAYGIMDLKKLGFPDCSFDSVACVSVIGQCSGFKDEVVSELLRVTKPGGTVFVSALSRYVDALKVLDDGRFEVSRFYALKGRVARELFDFFMAYRDWRTLFSIVFFPLFWLDQLLIKGKGETCVLLIRKKGVVG